MPTVEERLQAVEDRLAIIELEGRYSRAFDDHDGEAWCVLFTPDGIYQSRLLDERNASFVRGTDALRSFCNDAPYRGIHFMHLPQLVVEGDTAHARIHLEFYCYFEDEAALRKMAGYYDVEYVRYEGEWKIQRRITTTFLREQAAIFGYVPGAGFDDPRSDYRERAAQTA